MLPVSSRFTAAEQADVNQVAERVYFVLGNYASASGASASASGSDGSGDYPASGAIDGDRTELNVGPASGADNDVGLSSWRSAVAPSSTPQTLTVDMGVSRTINRIKLYHLASHGLASYKLESSPDNVTYTLIAKTTDQGGTIATTHQLDTVDFSDTTCRYVKITIADTVVGADKANIVELEIYRLVDISARLTNVTTDRPRDYKLQNPLAATFSLMCSNEDKFFSPNYSPTTAEIAAGFVNSELVPNIGVIVQYGFAYGGATPEFVTSFTGFVDRFQISPKDQTATIDGRDLMKPCINQIVSSKLKTAQDIKACIIYALNLVNISTWETSIDSTGLTIDYFFISNDSILTVIRNLVQASADALFWFDESGTAQFRYYVNSTPQSHTDSSEAQFEAGVLTNIDTTSTPNQIGRKWYLIDDFADGNFNSNPVWTNRITPVTIGDDSEANFEAGTVKTNISTTDVPGMIKRNWFRIDDFTDGNYTSNPVWTVRNGNYNSVPPNPANLWTVTSNKLTYSPGSTIQQGRANTLFSQATGTWECVMRINDASTLGLVEFFFMANTAFDDTGPKGQMGLGYCVRLSRGTGLAGTDEIILFKVDAPGVYTSIVTAVAFPALGSSEHTIRVTRDTSGNIEVYMDGSGKISASDTTYTTSVYVGVQAQTNSGSCTFTFDNFYYAFDLVDASITALPTTQAVFESRVFDQTTAVLAEGIFTAVYTAPSGTSVQFFTATSADGVSFDTYVAVTSGSPILSTTRRYIKYKILFVCPADSGTNSDLRTALIDSISIQYTNTGWQCITNAIKYLPGTSGLTVGIDTSFIQATGTWSASIQMTPGTGSGMALRMYILTTGYDIPTATYISGYYAQADQANGRLGIYKISASGTRTLLLDTAQTINTSAHTLRLTRTSAGVLTLFWDGVQKVQTTDTGFSSSAALAFEVAPGSDTNGNNIVDDIYYSPAVDGTGATSTAQATFVSATIDMGSIIQLGIFQASTIIPAGTSLQFYTATSADDITYDAFVAATPGVLVPSTLHRYLKWKVVMTTPLDSGIYANILTPSVTDVTVNWFTGSGSNKYPTSVSYVFRYDSKLNDLVQSFSDSLGGDSAIVNDVIVQAQPLILSGTTADTQWQGTTQTPPVPISVSAPLSVTAGTITIDITVPNGMDTSLMSGGSPAAAAITFTGGAIGSTWAFSRIHPTRPRLVITVVGTGTITDLRLIGKPFSSSTTGIQQQSTDSTSIKKYGDRQLSISNPYIINNAIAASIASKLVANNKNPISYAPQIMVDPTFSIQLGDRVTVVDSNTALNQDYIVAGVNHSISAQEVQAAADTTLTLLQVLTT